MYETKFYIHETSIIDKNVKIKKIKIWHWVHIESEPLEKIVQ